MLSLDTIICANIVGLSLQYMGVYTLLSQLNGRIHMNNKALKQIQSYRHDIIVFFTQHRYIHVSDSTTCT